MDLGKMEKGTGRALGDLIVELMSFSLEGMRTEYTEFGGVRGKGGLRSSDMGSNPSFAA